MKNVSYTYGFTLLDILLVSAIVSFLSSLFLFQVTDAKKKAEDAHMVQEAQQISTAIQLYSDNKGHVPYSTASGIESGRAYKETEPEYAQILQSLVPDYISEIPTSPRGDNYFYGFSPDYKRGYFIAKTNKNEDTCKIAGEVNQNNSCSDITDEEEEQRFTDNNNGTVTDNTTGREWQKASSGNQNTWTNASIQCQYGMPPTGTGGRLPTLSELQNIIDLSQSGVPMNPIFTNIQSDPYWTSTAGTGFPPTRWYYHMGFRTTGTLNQNSDYAYSLCVR